MKVVCIGRNYAEHIKELNNETPGNPVLFLKPSTAVLKNNQTFYHPAFSTNIHFECELVLRICKSGKYIQEQFAHQYFDAYTLGIDFTARDLQDQQKTKGLPWEIAKSFDNSAVIGDWQTFTSIEQKKENIQFSFTQNEKLVQNGDTKMLLFSFSKIIEYASQFFSLQQGDVIFTGTPAGVGPIVIGDLLIGKIAELQVLQCTIA
jgi:acylpyruvate hydrolase